MSRQDSVKSRVMTGVCEPIECRGRRAVRTEVAPTPDMFHDDKRRLLLTMMEEFSGDAHISFEGDLSALPLSGIPGASQEETGALKRDTRWPKHPLQRSRETSRRRIHGI